MISAVFSENAEYVGLSLIPRYSAARHIQQMD